jgi:hypothetical protein
MVRDTQATLAYARSHDSTATLGFNPDGMCQKVTRIYREIGPGAPSALASALMTPEEFRVYDVSKIRQGMIGYSDDPLDSNPFGHVYTWMGRRPGFDLDDPASLVARSNSVKSGLVVPVAGDFFLDTWGDEFQFAAVWMNGVAFPDFVKVDKPKPRPTTRLDRLHQAVDQMDETIDTLTSIIVQRRKKQNKTAFDERVIAALVRDKKSAQRTRAKMKRTIKQFEKKG